MEVKKQKLLCLLEPNLPVKEDTAQERESSTSSEEADDEEEGDLVGMRCSAPLKEVK